MSRKLEREKNERERTLEHVLCYVRKKRQTKRNSTKQSLETNAERERERQRLRGKRLCYAIKCDTEWKHMTAVMLQPVLQLQHNESWVRLWNCKIKRKRKKSTFEHAVGWVGMCL